LNNVNFIVLMRSVHTRPHTDTHTQVTLLSTNDDDILSYSQSVISHQSWPMCRACLAAVV